MSDSLGMRNIQATSLGSQARTLLALGNVDLARDRADAARRFHLNAGAQLEELEDDLLAADIHRRAGARPSAAAAMANARALVGNWAVASRALSSRLAKDTWLISPAIRAASCARSRAGRRTSRARRQDASGKRTHFGRAPTPSWDN